MDELVSPLFLLKLLLAIGSFVVLSFCGVRYRRLTGVLLTFPILNGLALISSPDPMRVADTVYHLVLVNASLFWIAITVERMNPWLARLPIAVAFTLRVISWTAVWFFMAYPLTVLHDRTSTMMLFATYGTFATAATLYTWRARPKSEPHSSPVYGWSVWVARIVPFTLVFFCIAFAVQMAGDQKWVGMTSALPLPGLFALASLSAHRDESMLEMRDTVLFGPLIALPFNWLFGMLAVHLPADASGQVIGALALLVAWSIAFAVLLGALPVIERCLDRRQALSSRAK